MIQKVDEVENVEVGKFYLVPLAVLKYPDGEIDYVPVIPIAHKDKQFGVVGSMLHYHIDGRFNIKNAYRYSIYDGKTNIVITIEPLPAATYKFLELTYKKKRCIRDSTGLNIDILVRKPKKWAKWADTMIGKSCKGKKCPHFGANMIEKNGELVCPIHNLKGDLKTLKIVKSY